MRSGRSRRIITNTGGDGGSDMELASPNQVEGVDVTAATTEAPVAAEAV